MADKEKNNVNELLELGEHLLKKGQLLGALKVFNIGLKVQPSEIKLYEQASKAFAEYLLTRDSLNNESNDLSFKKIIKQSVFNIDYDFDKAFNKEELLIQLILQQSFLDSLWQFLHTLSVYASLKKDSFKLELFREVSLALEVGYRKKKLIKT